MSKLNSKLAATLLVGSLAGALLAPACRAFEAPGTGLRHTGALVPQMDAVALKGVLVPHVDVTAPAFLPGYVSQEQTTSRRLVVRARHRHLIAGQVHRSVIYRRKLKGKIAHRSTHFHLAAGHLDQKHFAAALAMPGDDVGMFMQSADFKRIAAAINQVSLPPMLQGSCACGVLTELRTQGHWMQAAAIDVKELRFNHDALNLNAVAWDLAHAGRLNDALLLSNQSLFDVPVADCLDTRAYIEMRLGRNRSALADIDKALGLRRDPAFVVRKAQIIKALGKRNAARDLLADLKKGDPDGFAGVLEYALQDRAEELKLAALAQSPKSMMIAPNAWRGPRR